MANKRVNDDGSMKAVIYARYSSENQREESIEGQIRECYAFARKNNISVVAEYIDRAFSAKTDRRPDFQRMIKDSAKKNFNLVLVWKLDRFARNRYDSANYKATLKRNGVKVMSVTESISEGSEGILLESVLEGMAEYYSAELSEKVLRGHHENALKCRYNGGTLPIGFSIDKEKNYHVDPITSPYIVEAFTMYDEGRTMKEIVAVLNQHGLKNQRGGELNLNSVSRLLQNRFYIGEYKYREVLVPDGIPAIIPKDLFDRVQEKLAKNKKAPARHKAEDDYLLTTKLFCGDCQSLMFGESGTSQSGATYHYYKCSSAKKKTGCNRKPVKKKWIEDAVLDQVKTVLHDDIFIGDVVHKYLEYQQQENTVIPYLEKSLSDTQRSIDNLIAAIEQGIITSSTKQRLETLEVTKRELEDKILIENMKRPLRTEDELWAWFRYMRNFDLTRLEERRQLIDVFVNTVFLYNDRFLLTLNFGYGSKTVLFTDIPCSDKVACGRPNFADSSARKPQSKVLCGFFEILVRRSIMGKIDVAIIEALAQATTISVQEFDASAGTDKEHICWVKMNFIKHFTEDVFFLNDHSEDETFSRRNGNLIIRNMLEQLIEFLYLLKNPHHAEEYLGLTIDFEELNRKQSLVKKEELFGEKRYNKDENCRPSVSEMAQDIGEKSSNNQNLTLYKLYQILSERCHNSYFSSLLDDVNKVHHSIPNGGLSESQIKDVHIMSAIILAEFN